MESVCGQNEYSEKDNPIHMVIAKEVRHKLEICLMRLGTRTCTIVILRFGLTGREKTFKEIAEELHISLERVRQIYHKAMKELRVLRPLRTYGEISAQEFEAMKYIEPPKLPLFIAENTSKKDAGRPENMIDLSPYLHTRVIFKAVKR